MDDGRSMRAAETTPATSLYAGEETEGPILSSP